MEVTYTKALWRGLTITFVVTTIIMTLAMVGVIPGTPLLVFPGFAWLFSFLMLIEF